MGDWVVELFQEIFFSLDSNGPDVSIRAHLIRWACGARGGMAGVSLRLEGAWLRRRQPSGARERAIMHKTHKRIRQKTATSRCAANG